MKVIEGEPIYLPVKQAVPAHREVAVVQPELDLPSPLHFVSGFYLDDGRLGWELDLGVLKFETPTNTIFRAAFASEADPSLYDVAEFRIPVAVDKTGKLIPSIGKNNPIITHKSHNDTSLKTALRETAALANPSFGERELPRIKPDEDFFSFIRSIDFPLGQKHRLLDILFFPSIDDVIFNSSLASHLPEEFKNRSIGVDINSARKGRDFVDFIPKATLREKADGNLYDFARQTYISNAKLDRPTPSPAPEIPTISALMPDTYEPGLLKYIFNRTAWREELLYNAFSHELTKHGLEIISFEMMHGHKPMSGYFGLQDKDGRKHQFTTRLSYIGGREDNPSYEFKIMNHDISCLPLVNASTRFFVENYATSDKNNLKGIHDFAHIIAARMAKVFEAHFLLEDLKIPTIIKSAEEAFESKPGLMRLKGPVEYGPLKDSTTWEDIDKDIYNLSGNKHITGLSGSLANVLTLYKIGPYRLPPAGRTSDKYYYEM